MSWKGSDVMKQTLNFLVFDDNYFHMLFLIWFNYFLF